MEKQATLELNSKMFNSSKIEKVEKNAKETLNKINENTKNPVSNFPKISVLRKYGFKALAAGLFVCVAIKPSIVENIFLAFDFSQSKKDRTESRNIKFPKEVSI